MIRACSATFFLCVLAAVNSPAQEQAKLPEGTPPRIASVVEVKGDVVVYRDFLSLGSSLTPKEKGKIDPEKLTPAKPFPVPMIPCAVEFSLKDGAVFDVKGIKLSLEAAKKRLGIGDTVLVSTSGKKVDPSYVRIVKEDVLIFVHPRPAPATVLPPSP